METTFWEELRFGRHLLALVRDPSRLDHIRRLGDVAGNLKDPTPALQIVSRAMEDSGFQRLFARNYQSPVPDLRALQRLERGTLGRAYADHMLGNDLSVEFMQPSKSADRRITYLADRLLRTHDIFHVLTGYDTTIKGELALQAFYIGQLPSGVHLAILIAGLVHTLRREHDAIEVTFDLLVTAYQRGKAARLLLGVPWEERWHQPLADLRDELGLIPAVALSRVA